MEANYQFVSGCVTFGICACLLTLQMAGLMPRSARRRREARFACRAVTQIIPLAQKTSAAR